MKVQIKIAVAVGPKGEWNCSGASWMKPSQAKEFAFEKHVHYPG
jgi:hypothetical protein